MLTKLHNHNDIVCLVNDFMQLNNVRMMDELKQTNLAFKIFKVRVNNKEISLDNFGRILFAGIIGYKKDNGRGGSAYCADVGVVGEMTRNFDEDPQLGRFRDHLGPDVKPPGVNGELFGRTNTLVVEWITERAWGKRM
jgi:hypothetical protein